jgi:hypothetical protein
MKRYLVAIAALVVVTSLSYFGASEALQDRSEDPCAGKNDAECEALINQRRAEFDRRYPIWLERVQRQPLDLRSLPQGSDTVEWGLPLPDLPSAVRESEAIAQVQAVDVHFVPFSAEVTVKVERVVKGTLPSDLAIRQIAALYPGGDGDEWELSSLSVDDAEPLLFPGDRALLFLDLSDGAYMPQPRTGHYRINAENRLEALPSNPFGALAHGKPLEEFLGVVEATLAIEN